MIRTLDATAFNEIASDPEVRPWLGFEDPKQDIDLTDQVGDPNNFAFLTDHKDGGYLYLKLQSGLYAVHTLAKPSARGRPMLKLMRHGLRTLFTCSDCIEVVTQIPDGNNNAKGWSDLAGFRDTFRREAFFPLMGERVGCQFRSLDYVAWATMDKENHILGEQYQAVLAGAGVQSAPDPVRDGMLGATIAMAQNQNAAKGVGMHNRWASLAGYRQASLIGLSPPTIDTGDAVFSILNGAVEVLKIVPTRSVLLES